MRPQYVFMVKTRSKLRCVIVRSSHAWKGLLIQKLYYSGKLDLNYTILDHHYFLMLNSGVGSFLPNDEQPFCFYVA
jgi:hypothetical protein